MESPKKYPLVYLEWLDSSAPSGWVFKENIDSNLALIKSIGYVFLETENAIVISNHDGDDQFHSPMTIPKVAITYRETINFNKGEDNASSEGKES